MKLIFAVLDVSLTMGLTRCYKTKGFLHLFNNKTAKIRDVCLSLNYCDDLISTVTTLPFQL